MPSSRSERIAFGIGLGVIVALALLLLPAWKTYNGKIGPHAPASGAASAPASADSALARGSASTPSRPASAGKPAYRLTAPVTPDRPRAPSGLAGGPGVTPTTSSAPKLELVAVRGDCWVEVHAGDANGATIFVGTLEKGDSRVFPVERLWIRFGAPENIDALLGGRKITIPPSPLNFVVTKTAIKPAPEA